MRKGQEEAPIELLIGVTVLTFVLIIGFYTYQNMCSSQFEQKMQASLTKFANDLETVHLGSAGTVIPSQLDFTASGCPGDVDSVRLLVGSPTLCERHTASQDCYVLALVAKSEDGGTVVIMEPLNIRANNVEIKHEQKNGGSCSGMDRFEDIFTGFSSFGSGDGCFGWSMTNHALTLEKESNNIIIIHGG